MQTHTTLAPRFVALARGAQFGGRDEFTGWGPWKELAVAETAAYLSRLLARWDEYDYDLQIKVIDREPIKDAANWGPKLPWGHDDASWSTRAAFGPGFDADDLPF